MPPKRKKPPNPIFKKKNYEAYFDNLLQPLQEAEPLFKPKSKEPTPAKPKQQPELNSNKKKKKKGKKEKAKADLEPIIDPSLKGKVTWSVVTLYNSAIVLQILKRYKKAYTCYRALSKLVATEPMIWLRMAECILSILQDPVRYAAPLVCWKAGEAFPEVVCGIKPGTADPEIEDTEADDLTSPYDKIESEELTLRYADMCMMTCCTRAKDSDNVLLKSYIYTTHGYLLMKLGRLRKALQLFVKVLQSPKEEIEQVDTELFTYVKILCIQCYIMEGKYEKSLEFLNIMPNVFLGDGTPLPSDEVLYSKIIASIGLERYEEALEHFEKFHPSSCNNNLSFIGAYLYAKLDKPEEYQQIYDRLVVAAENGVEESEDEEVKWGLHMLEKEWDNLQIPDEVPIEVPIIPARKKRYKADREARKKYFQDEEKAYHEYDKVYRAGLALYRELTGIEDEEEKEHQKEERKSFDVDQPSTSKK